MIFRISIGLALLVGVLSVGTSATPDAKVAREKQAAAVTFTAPVKVGSAILMGDYLIVHDYEKDARGEPCTTIYRRDPRKGQQEAVVSFMCIPAQSTLTAHFTVTTIPSSSLSGLTPVRELKEFQFAGDTTAHQVPRDR